MRLFFLCTVSLPPCMMLLAALRARFLPAPAAARLSIAAVTVALAAAVISAGLLPAFGPVTARWSPLGPDAVAGVVNSVTAKNFRGTELSVRYGETRYGDGG